MHAHFGFFILKETWRIGKEQHRFQQDIMAILAKLWMAIAMVITMLDHVHTPIDTPIHGGELTLAVLKK